MKSFKGLRVYVSRSTPNVPFAGPMATVVVDETGRRIDDLISMDINVPLDGIPALTVKRLGGKIETYEIDSLSLSGWKTPDVNTLDVYSFSFATKPPASSDPLCPCGHLKSDHTRRGICLECQVAIRQPIDERYATRIGACNWSF